MVVQQERGMITPSSNIKNFEATVTLVVKWGIDFIFPYGTVIGDGTFLERLLGVTTGTNEVVKQLQFIYIFSCSSSCDKHI